MRTPNDMTCDCCGKKTEELRGVCAPWGGSDLCRECEREYKRCTPRTMKSLQEATLKATDE